MWEAKASKPGSPDRTTDHTPMRTKLRPITAHLHAAPADYGERPPRCQRRALEDDHHEIDELIHLARRGKPEGRRPSLIQAADSRPSMSPRIGRKR
jgi:hypothetical protein